jgi:DNA polymerase delta subunit 1
MWDDLVSHEPEGEWSKVGPLRILSFDIECQGKAGQFPLAEEDPVIQIANWVTVQGSDSPCVKNIFTLKSCAPISGAEVHSFENERDMLQAWRDFLVACDADILTGYNIVGFDIPYLVDRARALKVDIFAHLGRIRGQRCRVKKTTFSSAQTGVRESNEITIDGRVIFDVFQAIQRQEKLHSYSLNSVCAKFLNEQKEDVHHSIISDLQNGDAESRRRLAVYCLKDAYLPQRLMDKLMFLFNYMEMARVTGVPLGWLLVRGQMLKVMSQLLRKAQQKDLVIPALQTKGGDDTYEGATVIDPIKGFYSEPIATLDFASLYPSIMMAHNLCYSTLIRKEEVAKFKAQHGEENITRTPNGDHFVKPSVKKGILPEILDELLAARKRAKADLKKEKDPQRAAVLDGRQLALKVSANSVYGFTGATVGKLPCFEISAGVTSFGRDMIDATKKEVEMKFTVANGYRKDAVVVYGDTDSVMIKFGISKEDAPEGEDDKGKERWMISESMRLALEAAEWVNRIFIKPIKLEFEKVYYPYLLMNKKRYAALYWTNPDKFDKMDCKGIETVRRDNCGLVRTMIDKCLTTILMERNPKKAESYVKSTIASLLQNKVDISELIITKQLNKSEKDSKMMMAHVVLAKKMRDRDPSTAPVLGERVAYVIVKGCKGAKAFEKAEDPIFVLENNIPIDCQWYVEHQLTNPILRLFEAITENPKSLLTGERGDGARARERVHADTATLYLVHESSC